MTFKWKDSDTGSQQNAGSRVAVASDRPSKEWGADGGAQSC